MSENNPSLSRRRHASRSLSRLSIPNSSGDETDAPPPLEEVEEESRELFQHFVAREIENHGLTPPQNSNIVSSPAISTPGGYKNPAWAKAGKKLRMWADEFARTKQREKVRNEAENVDIQELTENAFMDLLNEAFSGDTGVTETRVLFVFFFCSDMAIRALRQKLEEIFSRIISWSMQFISVRVSQWVQLHGGWSAVLRRSFGAGKVLAAGAIVLVCIFTARYIYRRMAS